jgi:hypothetical protein
MQSWKIPVSLLHESTENELQGSGMTISKKKQSSRVLNDTDFETIACPPNLLLKLKVLIMIENILSRKLQDHIPKCLMVSFKDFNMLNQESYDVERVANARSQELTNRMLQALLKSRLKC